MSRYPASGPVTLKTNLADYAMTKALKSGAIKSDLVTFDFCGPKIANQGFKAMVRERKFDCVILDLKLPDVSGFELLSEIQRDEKLREIPIVVFTGRELTPEEEAELRQRAKSIVLKGVQSPERLLDETALFLHRKVSDLPESKQRMIEKLHESDEPLRLADRQSPPNAIEAPYLVRHDGYFYLFVSKDFCCKGVDSTYRIAVGRSKDVTGPYVDADGVPLLEDGGTPVLATDGTRVGPGGQSVSGGLLAFHWYDADLDGQFRLGLLPLQWRDGWPRVEWPAAD